MFQRLLLKDRQEAVLPTPDTNERLTRYRHDDDLRPAGSSQLTRFAKRHKREAVTNGARKAAEPSVASQQHTSDQGPDLDLYSDTPITVGVLMRALPQRFEQARDEISDAFDLQTPVRKQA